MTRTVLITGASSGFGKALAEHYVRQGWRVAATLRRPELAQWTGAAPECCLPLDVTDPSSIDAAVRVALDRLGGIDVLINNAGYALMGPVEGTRAEQIRRQIDTNLTGLIMVTTAVLPAMRQQGRGTIVNLSSIAGRLSFPMMSVYNASKFGVEGFTESLRYEVEPFGIRVKLVEPGPVRTDFYTRSLDWTDHPAYAGMSARVKALFSGGDGSKMASSPEQVVATVFKASTDDSTRLRYPVHHQPMWLARSLLGAGGWGRAMRRLAGV